MFVSANKILAKLGWGAWAMFDPNGKVLPLPAELNIINEVEYDGWGEAEDEWFAVSSG